MNDAGCVARPGLALALLAMLLSVTSTSAHAGEQEFLAIPCTWSCRNDLGVLAQTQRSNDAC